MAKVEIDRSFLGGVQNPHGDVHVSEDGDAIVLRVTKGGTRATVFFHPAEIDGVAVALIKVGYVVAMRMAENAAKVAATEVKRVLG